MQADGPKRPPPNAKRVRFGEKSGLNKASEEVYRSHPDGFEPPASSRITERKMEKLLCPA
jgi:hypothetical protein